MSAPAPSRFPPSRSSAVAGMGSARLLQPLFRAALATGIGALDRTVHPAEYARRQWGDDRNVDLLLRAAVSPTTLAGAPSLAQTSAAFLDVLIPASAGAALLARGVQLNFAGAASIGVPAIAVPTADFVAELAPIPVVVETTSAVTLSPFKLAVITTLSGEMMRSANAEDLIRQALIESTGPAIDKVLFSANAAGTDRPAGLLNGIAGLTPTASGPAKGEVLVDDLQKLAAAIAPVSGNGNVVLVASPDAAAALVMRLPSSVEWPVLTSSSLAARTVIAVAANAVVSAVEGAPQIDARQETELHRETNPQPIVSGSPAVVSTPVGSLFQTDQVALRLRWPISWALRASNGLAWMTNVNW